MLRLTPWRARAILVGLGLIVAAGLAASGEIAPPPRDEAKAIGDANLQLWTIERIRKGEPYYTAVGDELRKHAYPTMPVINWRTPLHYTAVAALSVERAGSLLFGLAMAVVVTAALAYARHSSLRAMAGALFLFAAMAPVMLVRPGAVVFSETWAGVFVALSLNAYLAGLRIPAALLGLIGLFVRELAAPYVLVCGLLAFRSRYRREIIVWIAGGVAYAIYYSLHAHAALGAVQPGDLVRETSYLRLLGVQFVFMTLYTYGGLAILPTVATPVAAALGLMGAWARSAPPQLSLSILLYFVLFCLVGQPFNFYWGFFTSALWGHAFVHTFEGGINLVRAAGRAQTSPAAFGPPART